MKIDIKWIGCNLKDVEITAEVFDGVVEFVAIWPSHTIGTPQKGKTIEEAIANFVANIDRTVGRIFHITDGVDSNGIFNLTLIESSAYGQETYDNPPRTENEAIAQYRKLYLSPQHLSPEQMERAEDLLRVRSFHRMYLRPCERCNAAHRYWTQNSPTTCQPDCATFSRNYLKSLGQKICTDID